MQLTQTQQDRARGVMLAMAAGDALGAPYEFGPPVDQSTVHMHAGGPWEHGEWTDDTDMALAIAAAASTGDLRTPESQDAVVLGWLAWSAGAKDVGLQTRRVLHAAENADPIFPVSYRARAAARALHEATGRTAGNGSLMRTAPVALAYLGDPEGLTQAARSISSLTHYDPENAEACILWCHAIRHAVISGQLVGPSVGLTHIAPESREKWSERLAHVADTYPRDYRKNGWVVEALLAAWSAIFHIPQFTPTALADTLKLAVSGGRDADTVAAICGGLAGAFHGAEAVPAEWRSELHGWPLATADTLVMLADAIVANAPGSVPADTDASPWAG